MAALSLTELRAQFPALDAGLAYFDWGATGLLPASTRAEIDRYVATLADCPDASGIDVHLRYAKVRNEARAALARMLGGAAQDVALVESTTQGIQIASECVRLQRGDNVIVFDLDYPAVVLPWMMRRRSDGIEVRFVPARGGRFEAADVLERIDDRTRVIAVSTICWVTGALTDVDAIAAETTTRGIVLVVDAIQSFGVVPFDVRKTAASFVAVGGLKWLCATPGSGFLWVSPLVAARSRPARFGFWAGQPTTHSGWAEWLMSGTGTVEDEVLFAAQGRSFETGGTPNYAAGIGLLGMARLLSQVAPGSVLDHVRALGGALIDALDQRGFEVVTPREPERRANMVVFRVRGGVAEEIALMERLKARRVAVNVRWLKGVGGVRVSIHGMNTRVDVARLLDALEG